MGVISDGGAWSAFRNKASAVFGLATGYGLDANVLDAYKFLMQHYERNDEIYMFGFSRGAYTVRMLAAFINMVGILGKGQENMASYALAAYKRASAAKDNKIGWRVQEVMDTERPTIRFMGCWDTVGSVLIPRPENFYIPSMQQLEMTQENASIQTFRHAMAIDEKRRMFRLFTWKEPQIFKEVPYLKDNSPKVKPQDIKQVWFSGVHSDIGGGYKEEESGLAKIPLEWMVEEAAANGLKFRSVLTKRLVRGQNPKNATRIYSKPNPTGKLHNSMNFAWGILEYLPKKKKWHDNPTEKTKSGFYLPRSESRYISEDAEIHPTVWERWDNDPEYRPDNLPSRPSDI